MRATAFILAATLAVLATLPAHAAGQGARTAAMPLTEVAAKGASDTLVIFYSGDGGWAPLDKGVAASLADAGMPVVGVNSLRYFMTPRTADGAAGDLAALIDEYTAKWGKRRVILAGYSFGADALPAIMQRLPQASRAKLRSVALVALSTQGELQFQPGSWLNQNSRSAYPVAPVLAQIHGLPMLCVYGDKDLKSACPILPAGTVKAVRLPGDHHFNQAYGDIARRILEHAA